eukprot:COSAG01_NODE_8469_length_2774_cov_12.002243_2_plen_507_part_01
MAFKWLKDTVTTHKPKDKYSLEQLQYLVTQVERYPAVDETNKEEVVESLRMMSELIIWGDQNNSSVLDYCLQKNVLQFFISFLAGSDRPDVQTQILQTLCIMLQNLKNNAYIYYMLSNNHLNSLIVHKFDFEDEELVGLYISLVKTIALKLDANTVQFFHNPKLNGMPLLTESINFYKNKDRNARIAIRTITLQVFKVDEASVEKFVLDWVAEPYFSNLCAYMGEEAATLDREFATATTKASGTLESLAAEHLDRLFYLSDVLATGKEPLRRVLCDQLLYRFLLPRVVASVVPSAGSAGRLSPMMAMIFIAQTLYIFSYAPLVNAIAAAVLCSADGARGVGGVASPYLRAIFSAMEDEDDRVVLAGLSVLLAIFDRSDADQTPVDPGVLRLAQLAPEAGEGVDAAAAAAATAPDGDGDGAAAAAGDCEAPQVEADSGGLVGEPSEPEPAVAEPPAAVSVLELAQQLERGIAGTLDSGMVSLPGPLCGAAAPPAAAAGPADGGGDAAD